MTSTELHRLMDDTGLLSVDTLSGLKQVVDEFPYFHTARMLYLKNLAVVNDIRFASELKKMAVYVPDRRKLFMLIEGDKYGMNVQPDTQSETSLTDTFALIDNYLSSMDEKEEGGKEKDANFLFQPSVSSDYIYWSLAQEQHAGQEEPAATPLKHADLIDNFLRNDEEGAVGIGLHHRPAEGEYVAPPLPEELPSMEDTGCFTETLARIYVKQKRYEKALQIIKNLSLKYPEKNVYFADQIRFLEKLIINTKK